MPTLALPNAARPRCASLEKPSTFSPDFDTVDPDNQHDHLHEIACQAIFAGAVRVFAAAAWRLREKRSTFGAAGSAGTTSNYGPDGAPSPDGQPPTTILRPPNAMVLPLNFDKHTGDLDEMVKRKEHPRAGDAEPDRVLL